MFFWPRIAIIISAFLKKQQLRSNCGIQLHDANLENSLMKERKNIRSYVLLPIFMFWYSRFSFRNLKDANSCMFLAVEQCMINDFQAVCTVNV